MSEISSFHGGMIHEMGGTSDLFFDEAIETRQ